MLTCPVEEWRFSAALRTQMRLGFSPSSPTHLTHRVTLGMQLITLLSILEGIMVYILTILR